MPWAERSFLATSAGWPNRPDCLTLGLIFRQPPGHRVGRRGAQVILRLRQGPPARGAGASQLAEHLVQIPVDLAHPNSSAAPGPSTARIPRAKSRQSRRLAARTLAPAGVSE